MTTCIWGVSLYIKLDARLRVKSVMQLWKLSYQSKLHRQNRSIPQTFSFFIRNFSLCRRPWHDPDTQMWISTVIRQAGLYSFLACRDKFVHWCFHLHWEVSFPGILSQCKDNLIIIQHIHPKHPTGLSRLLRRHTFCHVSSDHDNTVSHAQTGNLLSGFKIWAVEKAISYVHHKTGCGLRQILGWQHSKHIWQYITLRVIWLLLGQQGEIPERKIIKKDGWKFKFRTLYIILLCKKSHKKIMTIFYFKQGKNAENEQQCHEK